MGLLLAVALACAGCGGGDANAGPDPDGPPQRGGSIAIGMDQEPGSLNTKTVPGQMAAARMVVDPMLDNWVTVLPDNSYEPVLLSEVPSVDNGLVKFAGAGMQVTFNIRPEAHWSDGKPISCADMRYTWQAIIDTKNMIATRVGFDQILDVRCPTTKRGVIEFATPYAAFVERIFTGANGQPLPAHEMQGKDFNKYWNNEVTVTSGPFRFKHWKRNVEIVIERNPDYWNAGNNDRPWLDEIVYRFLKDGNTLKIQLRTGEVDWISPPPDSNLKEELEQFPRSQSIVVPGGFWEQLAFQTEKPPFDDVHVRRAVAYSIDRDIIADVVLRGQVKPMHSTLLPQSEYYVPAWQRYTADPAKVEQEMKAGGYTKEGGYWIRDGKPITIVFRSTSGNPLRTKVSQLIQQQLASNGFKMEIKLDTPSVFFGQTVPTGNFDLGLWAWSSLLDPSQTSLFHCDQIPSEKNGKTGNNNYHYCNEQVSSWFDQADRAVDPAVRRRLVTQIQTQMAADVPVLPVYQRPETVGYSNRLHEITDNPIGSHFWNVEDWWVSE